jgi:hypothetical protein
MVMTFAVGMFDSESAPAHYMLHQYRTFLDADNMFPYRPYSSGLSPRLFYIFRDWKHTYDGAFSWHLRNSGPIADRPTRYSKKSYTSVLPVVLEKLSTLRDLGRGYFEVDIDGR